MHRNIKDYTLPFDTEKEKLELYIRKVQKKKGTPSILKIQKSISAFTEI
jgi:hypothetical protein